MKKFFVLLLLSVVLVGCGGETAVETAVSEPTVTPAAAETTNDADPVTDGQGESGSISEAVIATSVETAVNARKSAAEL